MKSQRLAHWAVIFVLEASAHATGAPYPPPPHLSEVKTSCDSIHNHELMNDFVYAVIHASYPGYLAQVRQLIAEGAELNGTNCTGHTPLGQASHYAATSSSPEAMRLLIDCGADVNLLDRFGTSPLEYAVAWPKRLHSPEAIYLLQAMGAGPNKSVVDTALPLPVLTSEDEPVWQTTDTMFPLEATVEERDEPDLAPRMSAARGAETVRSPEEPSVVIGAEEGPNAVNPQYFSALGQETRLTDTDNSLDALTLLIEHNSELTKSDLPRVTALDLSCMTVNATSFIEMARGLTRSGATVNLICPTNDDPSFLHCMFKMAPCFFSLEVLRAMLEFRDCNVNLKDDQGNTPLILFARQSTLPEMSKQQCQDLVDHYIDHAQHRTFVGLDLDLHAAKRRGRRLALCQRERRLKQTPEVLDLLVDAGAELDASNTSGTTALMMAASAAGSKFAAYMASTLLKAGANPTLRDSCGKTARQRAREFKPITPEQSRMQRKVLDMLQLAEWTWGRHMR